MAVKAGRLPGDLMNNLLQTMFYSTLKAICLYLSFNVENLNIYLLK